MLIQVLIPAHNEELTIAKVIESHAHVLRSCGLDLDYGILILNDGSTDSTAREIENLMQSDPRISVIQNSRPSGLSSAFRQLYAASQGDWLYLTSADNEYTAEVFESVLGLWDRSHRNVLAVRTNKKNIYTLRRSLVSRLYVILCFTCTGLRLKDPGSTKLVSKHVLAKSILSRGLALDLEILRNAVRSSEGLIFANCSYNPRESGSSHSGSFSLTLQTTLDIIIYGLRIRFDLRARASEFFGF